MYEAPSIVDLGKVGDITLATAVGGALDADYPEDTPAEDIFS